MKINIKTVALSLAFMVTMMFAFSAVPVVEKVSFMQDASASALGDNITTTLGEWIPLVLLLAFVGIALGYLGIRLGRK